MTESVSMNMNILVILLNDDNQNAVDMMSSRSAPSLKKNVDCTVCHNSSDCHQIVEYLIFDIQVTDTQVNDFD